MASHFPPTESHTDLLSDEHAREFLSRAVKTTSSRTEHDSVLALFSGWDQDGYSKAADAHHMHFSEELVELQTAIVDDYKWNNELTILKSYRPDGQENEQKAPSENRRNKLAALQFTDVLETAQQTHDSDTNLLLIVFRMHGVVRTTTSQEKELYLWYVSNPITNTAITNAA